MNKGKLTLSIESAVGGGSIALLRGTEILGDRSEGNDCSRAEKILSTIDDLLAEAGVVLRDLHTIAVSVGPGSYSGIRIGVSTALGLSRALGIEYVGVSMLSAIAFDNSGVKDLIVAVPVGKNDVAWQYFSSARGAESVSTAPELSPVQDFVDVLGKHTDADLLAHVELSERLEGELPASVNLRSVGPGLAAYVGRLAIQTDRSKTSPNPMYLRNSRAKGGSLLATCIR